MQANEIIIVGGGLVGAAIAYGASKAGAAVTLLDQGDIAHRASRGNFGLIWVQSKGNGFPRYARWSRDAAAYWPQLAKELLELTSVDVALQNPGGFWVGFSDAEVQARAAMLAKISKETGGTPFEVLDHRELKARLPAIGPKVAGGTFCPLDGHANPLMTLHALHAGLKKRGARIVSSVDVATVVRRGSSGGFEAASKDGQSWRAARIVLAAGLSNRELAPQIGLHAPVSPSRGQVLITERLKPFLHYPTNKARQTQEGTFQLGSSTEDVGFDDTTTVSAIETLARKGIATFPILSTARLVRAWGALRVMTPDGAPIYQESTSHPGAVVATSHSGVSLAAAHAYVLGPWMAGFTKKPDEFAEFAGERYLDPTRSFSDAH